MIRPDKRIGKSSWKDGVLGRAGRGSGDYVIERIWFMNLLWERLLIEESRDVHGKYARRKAWLPLTVLLVGAMGVLVVLTFDDPIFTLGP